MSQQTGKPKVDKESPRVTAAMAKGEALWRLIIEAGLGVGLGLKIRDRESFDSLQDGEKFAVVRIATFFLKTAGEIDEQFREQIERYEGKAAKAPNGDAQAEGAEEIRDEETADPGDPDRPPEETPPAA